MKTYTAKELKEIIRLHKLWLEDYTEGVQADLSDADLSDANLRNADLRNADLSHADLSDADLSDADLRNADLRNADLSYANLRNANLSDADLSDANLSYTDLSYANLRNANLSAANLRNANLRNTGLRYTDLRNANWDYAGFNLSCKTIGIKTDLKLVYQLLYHVCRLDCDTPEFEEIKNKIAEYANKSHVIETHGLPIVQPKDSKREFVDIVVSWFND